jgi:uroporphyrinogen-III synthase
VHIFFRYARAVHEMRVLLTRPREDSERTARELLSRGDEAVIAPLFEITFMDVPEPPLEGVQAVLATSSNGVRALARRSPRRDIPVFAVGTQSAVTAALEGFRFIRNAEGDAAALASLVQTELRPDSGALLHATGTNVSPALSAGLREAGFEIRSCVLYGIIEADKLPDAAVEALRSGQLDAVLIYSPRSARLFADLVKKAGLAANCGRLIACCISSETSAPFDGLAFADIRIAASPDQDSLLALLGGY